MSACFVALQLAATFLFAGQVGTSDSSSNSDSSGSSKQTTVVHAEAGDYEISLAGMGDISGLQMSTRYDLARMPMQHQTFQNFEQTNDNGIASGGVGGAGGGFGQTYRKPNFGIAMEVKPVGKQVDSFVELGSAISIVESDGSTSASPPLGPVIHHFIDFEKQHPGAYTAYLYREGRGNPTQVNGVLQVVSGRRVEAQFEGTKKQSRRVGGEAITLESVKTDHEGVHLVVSFPELTSIRNARTPQERFEATVANRSAYSATIEDSKGTLMTPTSGSNLTDDGQKSFSFSNINGARTLQGKAGSQGNSTQAFTFKPLARGAEVERITVTFTDRLGDVTAIPFSIPLEQR